MFRRKNYKTRVGIATLPTELWLVIFDIVIEEGIIWLDQCDYTTFPHLNFSLSDWARHRHFYNSYYQLRLVCRRFNTLLGPRPWQSFSRFSLLPFPPTTRSLYIHIKALLFPRLRQLFAETSTFGRLVSLDVDCYKYLFYFLGETAGRAFPNIKRLILRVENTPPRPQEGTFWALLHSGFPLLVTFILRALYWTVPDEVQWKEGDEVICFERLEILYFSTKIPYLGCDFPRLRHARVWRCSLPELEILTRSPHLESLLIQSYGYDPTIEVASCLRLKLLGLPDDSAVVQLGRDHPVEHLWLRSAYSLHNSTIFEHVSRWLPKVSRITVEYSSYVYGVRGVKLGSFRLSTRLSVGGDRFLIFEREGVLRNIWSKLRQ